MSDLGFVQIDRTRERDLLAALERHGEPYEGFVVRKPLTAAQRVRAQYAAARQAVEGQLHGAR